MNTLEVLTLMLVVFAALSYIDDHLIKRNSIPLVQSRCYSLYLFTFY